MRRTGLLHLSSDTSFARFSGRHPAAFDASLEGYRNSVRHRAAGDVDRGRGDRAGAVRGGEGGDVGDVLEGGGPLEHRRGQQHVEDLVAALEILGQRLGHAAGVQGDDPNAVGAQLGRELAAHGLDRVQGHLEAADVVVPDGVAPAVPAEHQDDPRALLDHVAARGPGGDERRADGGDDGPLVDGQGHLDQWRALDIAHRDQVERDVEAARVGDDSFGVRVDRILVEGVDLGGGDAPAAGPDLVRQPIQRRLRPPREVDGGPLAREAASDRAPDRAGGAVDDGVLVLEQHEHPLANGTRWFSVPLRGSNVIWRPYGGGMPTVAQESAPADLVETLTARVAELARTQQQEYVDGFLALFDDDAVWVTGGGRRLVGRPVIAEFTRSVLPGAMAEGSVTYVVDHVLVIRGHVALTGVNQQYVDNAGHPTGAGLPTYVWRRREGAWLIVAGQNTGAPAQD